jgi:uncharacterized protein
MTQFFEKKDRWGHGNALWVIVLMVFLVPIAWWSFKQIDLENDVENWLPSDDPQSKILSWYHEYFVSQDRVIVSWNHSRLDDPRIARFEKNLIGDIQPDGSRRNGVKYVESVITPADVIRRMENHKVSREEALLRLKGILLGSGPLKIVLSKKGKQHEKDLVKEIQSHLESKLNLIASVEKPIDFFDEIDGVLNDDNDFEDEDFDEETESEDFESFISHEYDLEISWPQMHSNQVVLKEVKKLLSDFHWHDAEKNDPKLIEKVFIQPFGPVAISVVINELGSENGREAFEAIRQAAYNAGIKKADLHIGGRPITTSELNQSVKRAAWDSQYTWSKPQKKSIILTSMLLSVLLAFLMLKSVRLALLVLVVSLYTTYLAISVVPVTNGSMNMVLVVMPTLLSVLTISAAIHVVNYWKHAAHEDLHTAVSNAVRMAKKPCVLASFTTAVGLLSLTTSPLAPVRDFGLYSAIGCLISLIVVIYCLPALLQFWPAKPPKRADMDHPAWRLFSNFLTSFRTPVAVLSLIILGVSVYGLKWFQTETKIIRYFPEESQLVQDYNFLENNITGIIPVQTIIRFEKESDEGLNFIDRMEIVRAIESKIRKHPEISGTMSLADFQPVRKRPSETAGFRTKVNYNRRATETEKRIRNESESGTKSFLGYATESADLYKKGDQKLARKADEIWRISAQVAILSDYHYGKLTDDLNQICQSELKHYASVGHHVTGMVPLFLRTQEAVLESLIQSFGLAFAIIAVVMMILLKNPLSGLLTMIPNLLPIGIIFGLISWAGIAVDIGIMITASVALGIAVDGTVHLLTWFQSGIREGLTRREAVTRAMVHCGPAMWQTSAVVGLGLLMLYPADLLLISRFGWLMAALIGTALIADLVTLPAFLAGPLGALIEKTILKEQEKSKSSSSSINSEMLHSSSSSVKDPKSFRVISDSNKTDTITQ